MSDTQAAMHEFRFLDERRKTNGLTPAEEQRWQELANALGVDLSEQQQQQTAPQGYYGPDGQWYPYAPAGYDPQVWGGAPGGWPGYYPPQPQGYYGQDGQWYPAQQPYYPQPQGYYGQDGQWYPAPQPQGWYDPSQQQQPQWQPPQPQWDPQTQQWVQPQAPQWDAQSQQWVQPAPQPWQAQQEYQQQQPEPQPLAHEEEVGAWPSAEAELLPPPEPTRVEKVEPVAADEVMEIGDEEVVEIPSGPPSQPEPVVIPFAAPPPAQDPVAALRDALPLDDEEGNAAQRDSLPLPVPSPGAVFSSLLADIDSAPAPAPQARVPEVPFEPVDEVSAESVFLAEEAGEPTQTFEAAPAQQNPAVPIHTFEPRGRDAEPGQDLPFDAAHAEPTQSFTAIATESDSVQVAEALEVDARATSEASLRAAIAEPQVIEPVPTALGEVAETVPHAEVTAPEPVIAAESVPLAEQLAVVHAVPAADVAVEPVMDAAPLVPVAWSPVVDAVPLVNVAVPELPVMDMAPLVNVAVPELPVMEPLPLVNGAEPELPLMDAVPLVNIAEPELPLMEPLPLVDVAEPELPLMDAVPLANVAEPELPLMDAVPLVNVAEPELPVMDAVPLANVAEPALPIMDAVPLANVAEPALPIMDAVPLENVAEAAPPAMEALPIEALPVATEPPQQALPVAEAVPVTVADPGHAFEQLEAFIAEQPNQFAEPMQEFLEPVTLDEPAPAFEVAASVPLPAYAPESEQVVDLIQSFEPVELADAVRVEPPAQLPAPSPPVKVAYKHVAPPPVASPAQPDVFADSSVVEPLTLLGEPELDLGPVAVDPMTDVPPPSAPRRAPVSLEPAPFLDAATQGTDSFSAVLTAFESPARTTTPVDVAAATQPDRRHGATSAFDELALPPEPAAISSRAPDASEFGTQWSNEPEERTSPDIVFASNWDAQTGPGEISRSGHDATSPGTPMPGWEARGNGRDATTPGVPIPEWGNEGAPGSTAPAEWTDDNATLAGSPEDRVELASNAEFLQPTQSAVIPHLDDLSIDADLGDFVVESGSAAALANNMGDDASGDVETTRIPLATNADFIAHPQLTSTGESFTATDRAVPLEEEVLEGEVIAGEVIGEVDVDVDLSGPTGSWAAVVQPAAQPVQPPPQQPPVATRPLDLAAQTTVPAYRPAPLPPQPAWVAPELPSLKPAQRPVTAPLPLQPIHVPSNPVPQAFDRSGAALGLISEPGTAQPVNIIGEHRVILHTMEGGVKRGSIRDVDLSGSSVSLATSPATSENVPRERVKALFFMLAPGSRAPTPEGTKVRVTFRDGRQVAGFSKDHKSLAIGFFVVPADNRTNTERIFIYRHAVATVQAET